MSVECRSRAEPGPAVAPPTPPWLLPAIARFPRSGTERAVRSATETLADHVRNWGPNPVSAVDDVADFVAELATAELTGRGGGHFPAATKWQSAVGAGGNGYVVANGAEGEPLSAKDAALLQTRPHLVLDGLELAALATRAEHAIVWLHAGARATHASVSRAVAERRVAGFGGPRIEVRSGPEHYLTGESSAVMNALSGGPALPQFRRVPGSVSGVDGRPTLLHNVETLARIAVLARGMGATAVAPRGGISSTLVTLLTPHGRTVTEVRPGTALGEVITSHLPDDEPAAVLLGGFGGTWAPWDLVAGITANEASARLAGLSLGAGILAPLPTSGCGVAETARILDFLAASSARQCGPCLFGLQAVAELINSLAAGRLGRAERRKLSRHLTEIAGRGGCHHPDGAISLVTSMLRTFADDVEHHLRKGRCSRIGGRPVIPVPVS